MVRSITTEAIVLRRRSLPNEDLIIHLFTKERGKLVVFAKGIKKITSRRLPHTQVGNLIKTVIHVKDNRFYLSETQLVSAFSKIKEDEHKLQYFYFSIFLLDRALPEQQKEDAVYQELLRLFIRLSKSDLKGSDVTAWANRIMRLLGFIHEDKPYEELFPFIENIIEEKLPVL